MPINFPHSSSKEYQVLIALNADTIPIPAETIGLFKSLHALFPA